MNEIKFTNDEWDLLQSGTGPWPHAFTQEQSLHYGLSIEYIPEQLVNPNCQPQFKSGCFVVTRRGGGRISTIPEDNPELLIKVIKACASSDTEYFEQLFREKEKAVKEFTERKKVKPKTNNITLEDLGL